MTNEGGVRAGSLGSRITSRQSDTERGDISGTQMRVRNTTAETATPAASHLQLSWKKLIT
jgi:hypothetical protein